ncbi:hypothetical protein [Litorilituus lipolyticus]|uniref:Uncharacterized protein n=1 Tax=Litorilituus lipolyticus TaxID=2491017 RepID=A0A502KQC8_9GAMM|nr:hypothetical protein [Litorilituus lipolyticus]TPH13940.1 hypothetical protein EPA86_12550 [Litorilituus lipolyticus]
MIHAITYGSLIGSGILPIQIAREQPISSSRLDLVVFDKQINGQFYQSNLLPKAAIEVKGGAYGNRNALHDEISSNGYCADMDKLEKEALKGVESWFICIDMPELGRSINLNRIADIYAQCKSRHISFAYYCQGEDSFFNAPTDTKESYEKVNLSNSYGSDTPVQSILNIDNPAFITMCNELLKINGHEANTVAALYQLFRDANFGVQQLSLETYFSFAKTNGSRMHDRPDMVIFNQHFDGKFNLYKGGNKNCSNDAHKMAHINTIFEVKGSALMNKKGDSARLKIYLDDITKLQNWQNMASKNGSKDLKAYFICLDGRKKSLHNSAIEEMVNKSSNVSIVYIGNERIEVFP